MIVPLEHVLVLALAVFLLGAGCALLRRNLIMILLGVEIMLNASGIALVGGSLAWRELHGQAFVLFIMGVAAAEVAVGLALVVYAHRRTGRLDADHFNRLRE
jgi:NADH-quinone oxidoreductase subunit K